MLEQKLAIDGLDERETRYLEELGIKWGVYSEEGVTAARAVRDEVNYLADAINNLPDGKEIDVILNAIANIPGGGGGSFQTGPSAGAITAPAQQEPTPMQSGGSVFANKRYLVGEVGPELFVPQTSGQIIPNHAMGGNNVTINVSGAGDPETVANLIMRRLNRQGVRA
jgi:hypothetical protein